MANHPENQSREAPPPTIATAPNLSAIGESIVISIVIGVGFGNATLRERDGNQGETLWQQLVWVIVGVALWITITALAEVICARLVSKRPIAWRALAVAARSWLCLGTVACSTLLVVSLTGHWSRDVGPWIGAAIGLSCWGLLFGLWEARIGRRSGVEREVPTLCPELGVALRGVFERLLLLLAWAFVPLLQLLASRADDLFGKFETLEKKYDSAAKKVFEAMRFSRFHSRRGRSAGRQL